jgi:hypothetical protein
VDFFGQFWLVLKTIRSVSIFCTFEFQCIIIFYASQIHLKICVVVATRRDSKVQKFTYESFWLIDVLRPALLGALVLLSYTRIASSASLFMRQFHCMTKRGEALVSRKSRPICGLTAN